ncbi:hypothetical protein GCM10010156_37950 [Planobispora rosea]|uniref:RDD domain-containing protein n=1 Tax=Planobispora rosea TaxID=35762 RepID=A0A8J3RV04_PLARO|nr:hypothetical protein GCM10010156_37950 [Planobispora rosea]GIH81870.1 hypothetical protein Pro02_02780 [Planobispora rosea]
MDPAAMGPAAMGSAGLPEAPIGGIPPPGVPAPPAGWRERLLARIIDGAPFVVLHWILSFLFYAAFAPEGGDQVRDPRVLPGLFAGLIAFGAYTLYDYALHRRSGRTLGKKVMGIRVVPCGAAPEPGGLLKRAVLYPGVLLTVGIPVLNLPAAVFGFLMGLSILLDGPLLRGFHDRVAGTLVVKDLG